MIDPALREDPYALQKHLGFEITDWQQGFARVEMPIREVHGNRYGIPHGGVHATLIDTAMGFSGCYTGDPDTPQMAMTLSLTVNYLGQAKGQRLIVESPPKPVVGARCFSLRRCYLMNMATRLPAALAPSDTAQAPKPQRRAPNDRDAAYRFGPPPRRRTCGRRLPFGNRPAAGAG